MTKIKPTIKRKITKDQLLSWIITLSPILLQYKAFVLTYGLLLLIAVYVFFCGKFRKIYYDKDFIKLGIILFLQQVLSMMIFDSYSSTFINTIIMMEITCVIVVIGRFIEDKNILYDTIKKFSILCTIIIIFQFLLNVFLGIEYKALILLPQSNENMQHWIVNRPASLFTEPQTYATFTILVMMCALYKKEIKLSLLFLVGIIICGSSSGILVAFMTLLFFVIKNKDIKIEYKYTIVILIFIIALLMLVMPVFSKYLEKIYTIFGDISQYLDVQIVSNHSYSNYLRLMKSWHTYMDYPLKEKIVGTGLNNFVSYLKNTDTVFIWNKIWDKSAANAGYYSSAGGVFVDCGLIVAIYYYGFLFKKYNKANSYISQGIIILIIIQSIYTQIFFNPIFLYYFLLYNAFLEKKEINRGSNE